MVRRAFPACAPPEGETRASCFALHSGRPRSRPPLLLVRPAGRHRLVSRGVRGHGRDHPRGPAHPALRLRRRLHAGPPVRHPGRDQGDRLSSRPKPGGSASSPPARTGLTSRPSPWCAERSTPSRRSSPAAPPSAWDDLLPRDQGRGTRSMDGVQAVYGGSWTERGDQMIPAEAAAGKLVVLTAAPGAGGARSQGREPRRHHRPVQQGGRGRRRHARRHRADRAPRSRGRRSPDRHGSLLLLGASDAGLHVRDRGRCRGDPGGAARFPPAGRGRAAPCRVR